tara:strand:- start:1035 stop:1274 length:240 start_codon:yes stop_codon:yes gene_type:complete
MSYDIWIKAKEEHRAHIEDQLNGMLKEEAIELLIKSDFAQEQHIEDLENKLEKYKKFLDLVNRASSSFNRLDFEKVEIT